MSTENETETEGNGGEGGGCPDPFALMQKMIDAKVAFVFAFDPARKRPFGAKVYDEQVQSPTAGCAVAHALALGVKACEKFLEEGREAVTRETAMVNAIRGLVPDLDQHEPKPSEPKPREGSDRGRDMLMNLLGLTPKAEDEQRL
jgi:hypothetical protein